MKRKVKRRNAPRGKSAPARSREGAKESEEIVLAIRRGKIDALVMAGADGERVMTLQGSEHPYRVLVESINDGVATLDLNGIVLYANRRFAAIFRTPVEKIIGTSLQGHLSPSYAPILQNLISRGLSNSSQGELTLHMAEGRPRMVRLALNPIGGSDPPTVSLVATELTELAEANEALRSNEESLRQLSARLLTLQDEERRHIARDLHDITGQKLAVQAMGLSQVLSKTSGVDEDSRHLLSECAMLGKQVGEEIRTLSYVLHPPLLDELGLASAVRWYAEGFEQRAGIRMKVEVASDFVRLPADVEVTLFRIIQESLTNVQRYSDSQKAYVRVKQFSNRVEVQIGDYGKGIPANILDSKTGRIAPLGVGIQGMRERMRQLGGKLEISSRASLGTEVTATLPISRAQTVAQAECAGASDSSSPEPQSEPADANRSILRKQILIVDDHEMLRRGIRSMLEKESAWEVCGEAVNGQEAVDKTIALNPDLVILDINMPVLNGLVAIRQILRNRPQTKILIFTVHDSDQTMKEIQAAGAHGYLSKSNASDDLLRVVKELLEIKTSSSRAAVAGS